MTYNLCPGLKQVLEDKRLRRFGVPKNEYANYLMAEQFVVDCRDLSDEELDDIHATYDDLAEMGLTLPPYPNIVFHVIWRFKRDGHPDKDNIISLYQTHNMKTGAQEEIRSFALSGEPFLNSEGNADESEDGFEIDQAGHWLEDSRIKLLVMLATKNIIKDKHEVKHSQKAISGFPHKKGSGGYTIIRTPETHEIEGGASTGKHTRPHFRRGHIRRLDPNDKMRWIMVSPCFVNGEPEVARKAYLVTEKQAVH